MSASVDRSEEGPVGTSVGKALAEGQAFTTTHPMYKAITSAMESRLSEVASQRAVARASTRPSLVVQALDVNELAALSSEYPEFTLMNYGSSRAGHASWVAARALAREWCGLQAERYGSSVAHLGGSLLPQLIGDNRDFTLLYDRSEAVAVHERYESMMNAARIFSDAVSVSRDIGREVSLERYNRYLRGEGMRYVALGAGAYSADVLCVDGALYGYTPTQVASMMLESGAGVTFGFFPYHNSMLLHSEGEIPGTGVEFSLSATHLNLAYPDGVAGVARYSRDAWEAWLVSHSFSVGGGAGRRFFQLELMNTRGGFMFYRLIKLPCEPAGAVVRHALDVGDSSSSYLVTAWELTRLGANPDLASSWRPWSYVVSRRLVDRVYQFSMQLKKEDFSRYAVRKQLHVVNDRVTVEGTSVKVNSPLGVRLVNALVVAIYSRAFVDRYESGTLSAEAVQLVQRVAGYSSASWVAKVSAVCRLCAISAWDATLGAADRALRDSCDKLRGWFRRGVELPVPEFVDLPSYVVLSDVTGRLPYGDLAGMARAADFRASAGASGFGETVARYCAMAQPPAKAQYSYRVSSVPLFDVQPALDSVTDAVVDRVRELNPIDEPPVERHALANYQAVRVGSTPGPPTFHMDPDPVHTLNEFYEKACPGVAAQALEYDTASISLDPQDRTLVAPYLRLPKYFGEPPKTRSYFPSNLKALNVPKRQQTLQELLSATAARNLNAPQVSLPQDEEATAREVWENFLDVMCVDNAREKLLNFQSDPVALAEHDFREWCAQATPEKREAVLRELRETSESLADMRVDEYLVMLKADVKPTLSTKPITQRTEPQVIVYHKKAVSALYSCIFRVLVRRFLSLLKPNIHVNLLKDTKDIESFVRAVHPFGKKNLKYLENDFSKYDKSQGRFVFKLEHLIFTQLGMNEELLAKWLDGHVNCSLRSVTLGLSLHVMYQRKSGDATTAFGNVLLNIVSVAYAYKGTKIVWALFMGDDSLVCATAVGSPESAVQVLAEVFNLGAKTYVTSAPYYASNFVLIDDIAEDVLLVGDPVKRIERLSMAVAAEDPQWHERYVSARDSLGTYVKLAGLDSFARAVSERYAVAPRDVAGVGDALATLITDFSKFRKVWAEKPEPLAY